MLVMLMRRLWKTRPWRTLELMFYDEKTSVFIHALSKLLETRFELKYRILDTQHRESILELRLDSGYYSVILAWEDNGEDGSITLFMIKMLLSLLDLPWESGLANYMYGIRGVSPLLKQALQSCQNYLSILHFYVGMADGMPRILAQVPASEFPINKGQRAEDEFPYELDVRIVCPDPQSCLDNPRPSLFVWTTHFSIELAHLEVLVSINDLLDWKNFRRIVIEQVEENEDGQLDAWQQRYMLACLTFKRKGTTTPDENRLLDAIISERSEDTSDESRRSKIFIVPSFQEAIWGF